MGGQVLMPLIREFQAMCMYISSYLPINGQHIATPPSEGGDERERGNGSHRKPASQQRPKPSVKI